MKRALTITCVGVVVLAFGMQARADTVPIPSGSYVYDYSRVSSGTLNGQDNWSDGSNGLKAYTAPVGGAPHPGTGLCLTEDGGTTSHYGNRVNDAGWSYDVSSSPQFAFGMTMSVDYQVSGYYGFGQVGIVNDTTNKMIRFGLQVKQWYYGVVLFDAAGTEYVGGQPRPTARNQKWYFKCEVDTTANGGEGSASVYTWQPGVHTTWQPMGNLQDINMQLATASADILNADRLHTRIQTRLVAIDDIWITPEPAAVAILGIGGVGVLLKRRRR